MVVLELTAFNAVGLRFKEEWQTTVQRRVAELQYGLGDTFSTIGFLCPLLISFLCG